MIHTNNFYMRGQGADRHAAHLGQSFKIAGADGPINRIEDIINKRFNGTVTGALHKQPQYLFAEKGLVAVLLVLNHLRNDIQTTANGRGFADTRYTENGATVCLRGKVHRFSIAHSTDMTDAFYHCLIDVGCPNCQIQLRIYNTYNPSAEKMNATV